MQNASLHPPELILFDIDLTIAIPDPKCPRLVPGVAKTVEMFRKAGVKIGFVTAGTSWIAQTLLQPKGIFQPEAGDILYHFVDGVHIENKADFVMKAARKHGIKVPRDEDKRHMPQVWIVGDSVAELLAARESGCTVITTTQLLNNRNFKPTLQTLITYLDNQSLSLDRVSVISKITDLKGLFQNALKNGEALHTL